VVMRFSLSNSSPIRTGIVRIRGARGQHRT
jgi:hypothetical protein